MRTDSVPDSPQKQPKNVLWSVPPKRRSADYDAAVLASPAAAIPAAIACRVAAEQPPVVRTIAARTVNRCILMAMKSPKGKLRGRHERDFIVYKEAARKIPHIFA